MSNERKAKRGVLMQAPGGFKPAGERVLLRRNKQGSIEDGRCLIPLDGPTFEVRIGLATHEADPVALAIRSGDWRHIATHVRSGGSLEPLRELFADILEGKRKRPNNRAPAVRTRNLAIDIAARVQLYIAIGCSLSQAETEAMSEFNVGRSTVQRAVRRYGSAVEIYVIK
jgi:hypothetical protein